MQIQLVSVNGALTQLVQLGAFVCFCTASVCHLMLHTIKFDFVCCRHDYSVLVHNCALGCVGWSTVGGVTTVWCVGTDNSCSVSGGVAMATLIAHSISVHAWGEGRGRGGARCS